MTGQDKKRYKVGLIGLGFIGKVHALGYHTLSHAYPHPEVLAVITSVLRSKTGTENDLLATLGSPLETDNMDAFLDSGLDLVDICTPNHLHLEQAKAAAARKVHIYCEKPLGLNLDHARRIHDSARQAGVHTHTAFMMRYYPAVRQAKAILSSGTLGEIYNFRANLFHNSYIDPKRPSSWKARHSTSGGGSLADLGIHMIDLVRYLLGEAEWVQGRTRTFITQRPASAGSEKMDTVDVDDWGICQVGLKSGAQGVIETTRMSGGMGNNTRVEIFGSRGSLDMDLENPLKVRYYDQASQQVRVGSQDFPTPPQERPLSQLWPVEKMSLGHFRDAHTACIYDMLLNIAESKPSMVDFASSLRSQEILEAAYLSAQRNGEAIRLPLEE
jgi:predicted dehydrogenase